MPALRYELVKQLHFIAADPASPGRDVVVTIQHWKSTRSAIAVYVRAHNGVEVSRHTADTDEARERIENTFATARRDFADELLSEDAAGDEVARRGGPNPKYCYATSCGAQIPYASAQCAEGHAVHHINAGTYVMGANRRPPMTMIRGGRK